MRQVTSFALLIATALIGVLSDARAQSVAMSLPSEGSFAELPLKFEANQGQFGKDVRFVARASSYIVSLAPGRMELELSTKGATRAHITMSLVGATHAAPVLGEAPMEAVSNYYIGRTPETWRAGIRTYGRVRYAGVFPGVDLVLHGQRGSFEYDFVVSPFADPHQIRWQIRGADASIDSNGDLVLRVSGDRVVFHVPRVFQQVAGERHEITTGYALRGANEVAFEIAAYDRTRELVIDPVLSFATYINGNNSTDTAGIAVDGGGSSYIVGSTFATDFGPGSSGYRDAYVMKLNAAGNAVLWTTYLGGSYFDSGNAIALDPLGNVYFTGSAGSTDFPTTSGAIYKTCATPCNEPYLAKLTSGGTLSFSTLLGPGNASPHALAVDSSGNAYVAGSVASTDLPLVNAVQSTWASAFAQKVDASGTTLIYSTYLGGTSAYGGCSSTATGIAADGSGNSLVVGSGYCSGASPTSLQQSGSLFLVKIAPQGSVAPYITALGSSGGDTAAGIGVTSSGDVYIAGTTTSADFPLTQGAFRTTCDPQTGSAQCDHQVFILRLANGGTSLAFSTFLGDGTANGLAVDNSGNAYVVGTTGSRFFAVANPIEATLQEWPNTGGDAFVTSVDSTGTHNFSTYFGGAGTPDEGTGIAVNGAGEIYVSGKTYYSSLAPIDFPLMNAAMSSLTNFAGFVAHISNGSGPVLNIAPKGGPVAVVRNVSSSPLTFTSLPSFVSTDCASSLPAGGSCRIAGGGSGYINSNAVNGPQPYVLTGGSPGIIVSTTTLPFSPAVVGHQTSPQSVTITNTSPNSPLTIRSINIYGVAGTTAGTFSQSNNCGTQLAARGSCTLTVYARPTVAGHYGGQINLTYGDSVNGDSTIFSPYGFASDSSILVSTSSVQFGVQYAGSAALPRLVTLTNVDDTPVTVTGVSVTGSFTQNNTCTQALPPGGSCSALVGFQASGNGTRTGSLLVTHNGSGSQPPIQLSGSSRILSDLAVSPFDVYFSTTQVGSTSFPVPVQLTNSSSSALTITSISVPSEFAQTNDCTSPLPPGTSCNVTLTFSPSAPESITGSVLIYHTGMGSPQSVNIAQATGSYPLHLMPDSITFPPQLVGSLSGGQSLLLVNYSSKSITIKSTTVAGDFLITNNYCNTTLQGGGHFGCLMNVYFAPKSIAAAEGSITVVTNSSPDTYVIPLHGQAVDLPFLLQRPTRQSHTSASQAPPASTAAPGPREMASVKPELLTTPVPSHALLFAHTRVGSESAATVLDLRELGDAPAVAETTGDFAARLECPSDGKGSCKVALRFLPTSPGICVGTLMVRSKTMAVQYQLSGAGIE